MRSLARVGSRTPRKLELLHFVGRRTSRNKKPDPVHIPCGNCDAQPHENRRHTFHSCGADQHEYPLVASGVELNCQAQGQGIHDRSWGVGDSPRGCPLQARRRVLSVLLSTASKRVTSTMVRASATNRLSRVVLQHAGPSAT